MGWRGWAAGCVFEGPGSHVLAALHSTDAFLAVGQQLTCMYACGPRQVVCQLNACDKRVHHAPIYGSPGCSALTCWRSGSACGRGPSSPSGAAGTSNS